MFLGAYNIVAAPGTKLPVRPYFRAALFAFHYCCYYRHLPPPKSYSTNLQICLPGPIGLYPRFTLSLHLPSAIFTAGFSSRVSFFYRQSLQYFFPPPLQCVVVDKIVDMVSASQSLDQAGRLEHPYVLGDSRLGNSQKSGQGIDAKSIRVMLAAEQSHQSQACRVSECVENRSLLYDIAPAVLFHAHQLISIY
jgi:hypothetical protein